MLRDAAPSSAGQHYQDGPHAAAPRRFRQPHLARHLTTGQTPADRPHSSSLQTPKN